MARALVKGSPDVRLYVGTPEKNFSGIAFPEARLVWSETERDWRAALAAIREDPGASRFSRRGDVVPFRSEQLSGWAPREGEKRSGLERLVDLRDSGVITWTFTDASAIDQDEANWRPDTREYNAWIEHSVGKQTYRALKEAIGHLQHEEAGIEWSRRRHDGLHLTVDGIEIRIGRPSISLTTLETVACSAIVLVPHVSRRGPNGVWVIRRGERHPLEETFRDVGAWYEATADGSPRVVIQETQSGFEAIGIDLFRTARRAVRAGRGWRDVSGDAPEVRCATGADLLRLMSKADTLTIEGVSAALTSQGVWFLRRDFQDPEIALTTSEAIVQMLKPSRTRA